MQTSPEAVFISEVAHSQEANLPLTNNQVVVYDTRLRNWLLAYSGGLTYANPVVAKLNGSSEIVRIRTLEGSPYLYTGVLDIQYGTPGDTITWSGNTIVADALSESGVDIWVNGNTIDAFWVDSDAVTIKTARSTDGGHTWGAQSIVTTRSGQGLDVAIQLCAPDADTLIFSDSTVGEDEEDNPLTALYITLKVSGSWITPVLWDLGGQPLGIESQVELPNGDTHPSNLSGLVLPDSRLLLSYYGAELRDSFEDGVWIQRVANLNYSSSTQHLHWTSPEEIFQSTKIDDDNHSTQIFTAFPRLQVAGDEYWILALESSEFAGHERYHLAIFRSKNGLDWSDRDYRQGASNDDQEGAYVYNGGTPFLYTDLIYANLVVTAERTFIIGFDKVFYCASTLSVGEDNPSKRLDLTPYLTNYDITLSAAPTAGTANYSIDGMPKDWSESDILTAHHGVIIKNLAGYYDPDEDEDVLIQIGEFHVDEVSQHTEDGSDAGSISGIDNTMLLDRRKADKYWEWDGSTQLYLERFCDLSPFIIVAGSYTTGIGGRLRSGIVTKGDNFPDNIAVINIDDADGGFLITEFRCDRTWEHCHGGIAFQGKSGENKDFWAVLYNRKNSNRFTLNQAIPRNNTNNAKLYKYRAAVAQSPEITLDFDQNYFLKVGVWHSHVMAWYSEDGINWIEVINFTSSASPVNQVLPCRLEWWGLIGVQRTQPSGAIGNLASTNAMQALYSGVNPLMVALQIQLGDEPSVLRRVNVAITQENENSLPMPDARILLIMGDENGPFDATDEDNVLFDRDASALHFGAHDSPAWLGANDKPNPQRVRMGRNDYVYPAVTFNAPLQTGQSYKWASDDTGNYGTNKTFISSNEGETWAAQGTLNLTASIEVEYLNGRVKFFNLSFGTGEPVYTYEKLIQQLAAKAGVLETLPDSFIEDADLTLGPDDIYWQPEDYGTIGDFVLDTDVTVAGSPYSRIARILFGSSTIDAGDADSYIVELDPDEQVISFYGPGNELLGTSSSLQYIPDEFHLRVAKQNYFIYIYLNECVAGMLTHSDAFDRVGYVGLDSVGASFDNTRIPDMTQIVEYWSLSENESPLNSLQQLVAKPAPGTIARGKFFINYEGKLRFGSFSRQEQVDTYEDTMFGMDKSESARYTRSEIKPTGNYYGTHFRPRILSSDGRWYEEVDVTDGRSDENAYTAAEQFFRDVEEKEVVHSLEGLANYATEREDVVQVINPLDGTSGLLIVNDITFSVNNKEAKMKLGFRTKVE